MNAVLHIVYNLSRGGTEGQCAQTALHLQKKGLRQKMALFRRDGYYVNSVEHAIGNLFEIPIRRMLEWDTYSEINRLVHYIHDEQIDLIHAWDSDAAIFGALAARLCRKPYITSRRDLGQIYAPWKLRLMRWADAGAAAVVVNAEAIRRKLLAEGFPEDRVSLITNIFDLDEFDEKATQTFSLQAKLPAGLKMVVVARLDPEKDVASIIQAMAWIVKRRPDVSLIIAGDGIERIGLEQKVVQEGLERNIFFLGEVMEIPSLLKQCHLGLLTPKANEGLSNSILEYLSAGLPAIVTDCGGNRELVEEGVTGSVVPVGDVQTLAEVIVQWLDKINGGYSHHRKSRSYVLERHNPQHVVDQFYALYSRVLG